MKEPSTSPPNTAEELTGPTEWHRCLRLLDDLAAELRDSLRRPERTPARYRGVRS